MMSSKRPSSLTREFVKGKSQNRPVYLSKQVVMAHFLTLVLVDAAETEPARRGYELMASYFDALGEAQPPYKFDACVIGGLFNGLMKRKPQHYNLTPHEYQKRDGLEVITEEANMGWVADLPSEVIPDAIVTPDGLWHDPAGLSWNDWKNKAWQVLCDDSTRLSVAFDCHC
jgi:hypothetical protein